MMIIHAKNIKEKIAAVEENVVKNV